MTRSTFLLTTASCSRAMAARAQQSTSRTAPALLRPPVLSARGAAKIWDPCAEQQRAEEEERAAFEQALQEHERRQTAHKAATTSGTAAEVALSACRQTVDSGPGRARGRTRTHSVHATNEDASRRHGARGKPQAAQRASTPISASVREQRIRPWLRSRRAVSVKQPPAAKAAADAGRAAGQGESRHCGRPRRPQLDGLAGIAQEDANRRYGGGFTKARTPWRSTSCLYLDLCDLPPPTAPTNVPQRARNRRQTSPTCRSGRIALRRPPPPHHPALRCNKAAPAWRRCRRHRELLASSARSSEAAGLDDDRSRRR